MSTSAIIAARKRIETSLRNYSLPTDTEPQPSTPEAHDNAKNGSLLLSLLQSRLNWTHSIFIKYRADSTQQLRRAPNTRKKWPNMRHIGTCTVELGPHTFHDTAFYEAVRTEPWSVLAQEATGQPITTASPVDDPMELDDAVKKEQETAPDHHQKELVFSDVVLEFKELPGERLLFPKDMILQATSTSAPFELMGSFLLPLDPSAADDFFLDAKEKVKRWGKDSDIPELRELAESLDNTKTTRAKTATPTPQPQEPCQPANIRLRNVDAGLLHALLSTVHPVDSVRDSMTSRMSNARPKRSFLQHTASADKSVEELIQKALTVPEIASGPVLAEKKRNETLNAVRLGKRSRSEQADEAPKNKHAVAKDDGLRRCLYCSTKLTAMWRWGPEGPGTLCNGCGLLWSHGKILKGAPVISKEEEQRRLREQWEQAQEAREEEERERELQRQKQEAARVAKAESTKASKVGYYAAQILQHKHQKQQQHQAIATTAMAQTQPSPPPQLPAPIAPSPEIKKEAPSRLYNSQEGIPLPTLAIHFNPPFAFVHPNCSVTLMDACFSIRLVREGYPPVTLEIAKKHLQQSQFDVCEDASGCATQLTMTCVPTGGPVVHLFDTDLLIPNDSSRTMAIKFLEKMDPADGPVVKRILQKWLDTSPLAECAQ